MAMARSKSLREVENFIKKFPMADVTICPEDKLTKCPPEIFRM